MEGSSTEGSLLSSRLVLGSLESLSPPLSSSLLASQKPACWAGAFPTSLARTLARWDLVRANRTLARS